MKTWEQPHGFMSQCWTRLVAGHGFPGGVDSTKTCLMRCLAPRLQVAEQGVQGNQLVTSQSIPHARVLHCRKSMDTGHATPPNDDFRRIVRVRRWLPPPQGFEQLVQLVHGFHLQS